MGEKNKATEAGRNTKTRRCSVSLVVCSSTTSHAHGAALVLSSLPHHKPIIGRGRMNRKGLAVLMRTRMRPSSGIIPSISPHRPVSNEDSHSQSVPASEELDQVSSIQESESFAGQERKVKVVQDSMHIAITMNKAEIMDAILDDFAKGYSSLSYEGRQKLLFVLAQEYDVDRKRVHELMQQYLGLKFPSGEGGQMSASDGEGSLAALHRTERSLRQALSPMYEILFERLNKRPGGLKVLCYLRADLLATLKEENVSSLRALDSYLKEKLVTWLSPAALELHQITWDDSASLLEKIVAYEAVHPINSLLDLKRRLGVGRRCFGYLHPAIPGEPLIFIEVALMKYVAQKIQEVLRDDPPTHESEASCALFYSISSTQPGLAGINLGKFLIKRVINFVQRDMPHILTFATLSPIPGFMQWLISKLASQSKLSELESSGMTNASESKPESFFKEDMLHEDEEKAILEASTEFGIGTKANDILLNLLTSTSYEWVNSDKLLNSLRRPLMRLCARYLLQEKKRGKALDPVGNFHLQNGAMIGRLNWMSDRSAKCLSQSGGIMVNYIYDVDKIEEYAQSYFSSGHIEAAAVVRHYVEQLNKF